MRPWTFDPTVSTQLCLRHISSCRSSVSPVSAYFISGASSGLGAEMARQLSRRGDSVAVAARRVGRLEALAAELADGPGEVTVHPLDVTDASAVGRVIREADRTHGGLDVVVVNAGRGGGGRLGTGREEENRAVIETNLLGAMAQIETAMELFRRRGSGHLVLVSSLAAGRGLPGSAASYSAAKAALVSLGESLRIETMGSPISVTTLRPGYIRTEINEQSRVRFMTSVSPGVTAMLRAMDRRARDVVVPAWPWKPIGWALAVTPARLIRRYL